MDPATSQGIRSLGTNGDLGVSAALQTNQPYLQDLRLEPCFRHDKRGLVVLIQLLSCFLFSFA